MPFEAHLKDSSTLTEKRVWVVREIGSRELPSVVVLKETEIFSAEEIAHCISNALNREEEQRV